MPVVPDAAVFQQRLSALPVVKFQAGEAVLTAGATDGRLMVLRSGAVEVLKDGVQIAKVATPGAVFGEMSVLLDQSHTADVRSLEPSEFHIADATTLLAVDPIVTLYIASILAGRLDGANRAMIDLKRQLREGESRRLIGKTVERVEELLHSSEACLVYAGYPYDPFAERPAS
jgi:CRP-like cAMP-binding protein